MNKEKTICLCAIVKNEEAVVGRLIDSCIDIIDHWCIIDTGSTDKTKDVIRNKLKDVPGELFESPFINFGHNRTELVQKAKGRADYLLLMDADMTVNITETFDKVKLDLSMYHIRYTGNLDFAQPLFVSGHVDWRYEGVTHEYIVADGHSPVEYDGIVVTHHFDGGTRPEKLERDKALLERDIIDSPGNVRSYFYLAQTYANMKMFEQALKYYSERVSRGGWPEEVYYSKYQIGVMLYNMRKMNEAKLALLDGYEYRPVRFECLYMLGVICRELKQYNQAAIFQEKISRMPYPIQDVLFVHKNQYDYLSWFELGIDYFWIGAYNKAEEACLKVQECNDVPENIAKQNEQNLKFAQEKLGKIRPEGPRPYVVASMFTAGTPYEMEVKKLQSSLDSHGIKYEIVGVRSQGSWEKNTQLKPHIIKQTMQKYRLPVVWLDADAVVLKKPTFFETVQTDMSFYTLDWPNGFKEMLVGTMYFDHNKKVEDFLDAWIAINQKNNEPDGKNFQQIMEVNPDNIEVTPLPPEYIKIFDNKHIKADEPVIVHNQASRRLKDKVSIKETDVIRTVLAGLSEKAKSCAVVGNGPFKTNLDDEIDGSFVMRCNNFRITGRDNGIGIKTHLNISSLNPEITPKKKVDYPILGVLPISNTLYQEYTDAKMMHAYWQQEAVKMVQLGITVLTYDEVDDYSKLFKEVAQSINAFPTVGIMGIATARWLGFKKIIVTGFTFFESKKSHYFHDKKVIPSQHHNVLLEKELLSRWIDEDKDIEYVLDELTLKVLNDVKAKSGAA